MEYFSPLRYPGGKARLVPFFEQFVADNRLADGTYVEPYVGGGAVALSLLMKERVSRIVINDKDRSIYAFWYSLLHRTDELCAMIADTQVTMDVWYAQREVQAAKAEADLLQLAFSTFFLNRTNRSGILKAGVIGGNDQSGNYKIDARFNREDLICRIQRIAAYADRISLHNHDAVDLLHTVSQTASPHTFVYLDPPYYKKGRGLYMNYYKDSDHEHIRDAISREHLLRWVVTYDNSAFIKSLYSPFRSQEFHLNYSASNKGRGTEVMFFSDNCKVTPEALAQINLVEPC